MANYNHHAIHELPRNYSSYNWKFLLFDQNLPISPTSQAPVTTILLSVLKTRNNKCWQGCGGKGILKYYWSECKVVQSLWTTLWKFLEKLKLKLPRDPAIPSMGMYTKKTNLKRYLYFYVYCSIIHNRQDMEQCKCSSVDEWMKENLEMRKKEILTLVATWMDLDLEGIVLSEVSQKEKGKYYMISVMGGISVLFLTG